MVRLISLAKKIIMNKFFSVSEESKIILTTFPEHSGNNIFQFSERKKKSKRKRGALIGWKIAAPSNHKWGRIKYFPTQVVTHFGRTLTIERTMHGNFDCQFLNHFAMIYEKSKFTEYSRNQNKLYMHDENNYKHNRIIQNKAKDFPNTIW